MFAGAVRADPAERLESATCVVHFPPHARARAERILDTFERRRAAAAAWLGVEPAGRPRIHLVEDLDEMRARAGDRAPEWAVAVTRRDDLLAFRLDRLDQSPAESLDLVLKHEVVHQVLNHLSRRPPLRSLPRWFEEGLCVHHAGVAYLQLDMSLERMAAAGNLPQSEDADELFAGNGRAAAMGYKFGSRFVADFVARFGDERMRALLKAHAAGATFPASFERATGVPLDRYEREWRDGVTPTLPFWLFIMLENIELTLLCTGALVVAGGYARWRWRRTRAMESLGSA